MAKFEKVVWKSILISLLVISMFSFIVVVQFTNDAPDPISQDPIFNASFLALEQQIEEGTNDSQSKYGAFNSEEPKPGFGSIVLFAIVSVGKAFSQIVTGLLLTVIKLPLVVLGIPQSVYGLLLTWLLIAIMVGAWLLYKYGG